MKKQTYKTFKLLALLTIICLFSNILKAQSINRISDSVASNQLASKLSLTQAQVVQLKQAFNAYQQDISRLMKDSTIAPQQKQQQLKSLLAQRRQMLNATLNQPERDKLKQMEAADLQARKNIIVQKHQQELTRIPGLQSQTDRKPVLKSVNSH